MTHLSASFSATLRVRLSDSPGSFARVANAIGDAGGSLGAIDLVRVDRREKVRDVTVQASSDEHLESIVAPSAAWTASRSSTSPTARFSSTSAGSSRSSRRSPLKTRDDLSMAYTPGVARVCRAIAEDPESAWNLTIKKNCVAVVSDGTAVLGLGDIGPAAAMPVMEGKAVLFKEFAGVDAFPLCVATKDVDEIVAFCKAIAPTFGGINLEDISAPRCFEIEERLRGELDIPVFHDDQHGTAIVVLAALVNALRVVGKRLEDVKIVLTGVGAAGIATADILLHAGAVNVIGVDRSGAVHRGRTDLTPAKAAFAGALKPRTASTGSADEVLAGADVFIGLSSPGAVSVAGVRSMAPDAIVFAMANPTPEVSPEEIADLVAVVGTGRSDYPNQINNVLAFPGVFRGALDVRASAITEGMKVAASRALATVIPPDELGPEYVIPGVFNRDVGPRVAAAVAEAAEQRRRRPPRARLRARDRLRVGARARPLLVVQRLERVELGRSTRREDRREDPHDDRGDGEDDDLCDREREGQEIDLGDEDAGEGAADQRGDQALVAAAAAKAAGSTVPAHH